jgi:hypothetical protein
VIRNHRYQSINEDPFKYSPLTFHIKENLEDKEFDRFVEEFEHLDIQDKAKAKAMWQEKKRRLNPPIFRSLSLERMPTGGLALECAIPWSR